jgi:histidine triad (HIT) family protein
MASIFTKIISGELPCYKIYEDEKSFSFLALDQVHLGHTLVIPKLEVNHWFETPAEDYDWVQRHARKVAPSIQKAAACPRIGVMVAGFEVPHYHIHLIPAWSIPDLDFKKAQRRSEQDMKAIQAKILAHL